MQRDDLIGAIGAAADRAVDYPYKVWGFGEGVALCGMLAAGRLLGRTDLIDAVADIVSPTLTVGPDEEIDHLIPVEVLDDLHRLRPGIDIAGAVERFVHAVVDAPRPMPGRPRVHRPHHPQLGRLIWVDCLHTDVPGLIRAGLLAEAIELAGESIQVLQDAGGLFSHGYDVGTGRANAVHWARGQGWALHGLAELLPFRAAVDAHRSVTAVLLGLVAHEVDGRWHTIVDDPLSPLEASLSPMVATTVGRAIGDGHLDHRWQPLADRALAATLADLTPDGTLLVSSATPVGGPSTYYDRELGVFPWGQGPLLEAMIIAAHHRSEKE